MTELIALCMLLCVSSIALPGRTPSLNSSRPCFAATQESSHSFRIVRRIVDFVVAIRIRGARPVLMTAHHMFVHPRPPWLLDRQLHSLALRHVLGSIGSGFPILDRGACLRLVWPRRGCIGRTGIWGFALLGSLPGCRLKWSIS
ncbi:hypothetical protein B0O99DRAFT_709377 [Bisporella sp. PMI_857]|nr:hypothetical protein B0O99DRAFT_709377 [Bisporella sp. PMI_857]